MLNQLISHYKILKSLSKSLATEVYLAEDLKLNRKVVLKFFLSEHFRDSEKKHIFDEAQKGASFNHPNIATIYELGEYSGFSYIAMEYVLGLTLSKKISENLEIISILNIAIQLAEALKAIHSRNLIHCDIKSSNVLITEEDNVKILDFGLAKFIDKTLKQNTPFGTANYMSPEQILGESLDEQTDIFSLGVLLYEMVSGFCPFDRENHTKIFKAILEDTPISLAIIRSETPLELEKIIKKALQKNKLNRYKTANEILIELKTLRHNLKLNNYQHHILSLPELEKGVAFRGLLPFQELDKEHFYGRTVETLALFNKITHKDFKFGVIFGESGCGKTSLIKAGLIPKLWEKGYLPIYCRSYRNPTLAILQECQKQTQIKIYENQQSVDYLQQVAQEFDSTLVIICDQFEEFFLNFNKKIERQDFISFIAKTCNSDINIKYLFLIRSDFLYLIASEFDGQIPDPLINSKLYHLQNLNKEQAKEIIEKSISETDLRFEKKLLNYVVEDLAINASVLPSELQIVGEQLQNKHIFTLQEYKQLGGKEYLVYSFLEDVIKAFPDQKLAQIVLRSLISDENSRLTLSLKEIANRTQENEQKVKQILSILISSRLIREIQDDEPWRYELMHEYLIEKINQIAGRVISQVQRSNRLFRQYLSSYSVDKQTLIPLNSLWLIFRYSSLRQGEKEQKLLKTSLFWGIFKTGLLVIFLAIATTLLAALLSIKEEWESMSLKDGHRAAVLKIAISPNGKLLVSVSEDSQIIVWDFLKRERIATLSGHLGVIKTVAFSPNGKMFATGGADQKVIVWDSENFKKIAFLNETPKTLAGVSFSPDGHWLLSSTEDEWVTKWEVNNWKFFHHLNIRVSTREFLFSKDGKRLLESTGSAWDIETGEKIVEAFTFVNGYGATISQDKTQIVIVDGNGIVSFLDMDKRKVLNRYTAHKDNGRVAVFSPDSRFAATGAEHIILWDALTETKITRLEHTSVVWDAVFSPDGRYLVSSHGDGAIILWDIYEKQKVANFNEHNGPVRAVSFSPDGKLLASASDDSSVIIWNVEKKLKELVLLGHTSRVTALAFLPDSKSIVSVDFDGTLILWDLTKKEQIWAYRRSPAPSHCLAVSPDGKLIATSRDVHSALDGKVVAGFSEHYGVAFSPDGLRLVYVSPHNGGSLSLWDTKNWKLIKNLGLGNLVILRVSFSSDGKTLVTGEGDGTIRLWQVEPLKEIALLGKHLSSVKSTIFSPDNKQVASSSDDKTIFLWQVSSRKLLTRIDSHNTSILSIAFSPNGKLLASAEYDNSVRLHKRYNTLWGYVFNYN